MCKAIRCENKQLINKEPKHIVFICVYIYWYIYWSSYVRVYDKNKIEAN